jgi:hypothetical protein
MTEHSIQKVVQKNYLANVGRFFLAFNFHGNTNVGFGNAAQVNYTGKLGY